MTDDELAALEADFGVARCERCGFALKEDTADGCTPGNCSQRPLPDVNYNQRLRNMITGLIQRVREAEDDRDEARAMCAKLAGALRDLASLWMRQQAEYPPDDPRAAPARTAVRCCARELRAVLAEYDAKEPSRG